MPEPPPNPSAPFPATDLDTFAGYWSSAYSEEITGEGVGDVLNATGMDDARKLVRALSLHPFEFSGSGSDAFGTADLASLNAAWNAEYGSGGDASFVNDDDGIWEYVRKLIRAILEALQAIGG